MLLSQLGIPHEVWEPDVDERIHMADTFDELVIRIAMDKAVNVAHRARTGIVIGADTIVVLNDEIFGKPKDMMQAHEMLKQLQGATHQVYTGVAVVDADTLEVKVGYRKVDVVMVPCTNEVLMAYIATGEPMDKAGAYGIQGMGAALIQEIHGDYYAVVGLPLELTVQLLTEFGVGEVWGIVVH